MKILILRPEPTTRPAATGGEAAASSADVMAIGDGSGQWVLLNPSSAVVRDWCRPGNASDPSIARGPCPHTVLLTDAEPAHAAGLLSLRDGPPIELYATPEVFEQLTSALPILPVLQHYCGVHWHVVPVAGDREHASFRIENMPGLEFTAIAARSPCNPQRGRAAGGPGGACIAVAVRDLATDQRAFYAPGQAEFASVQADWMRSADCLLVNMPGQSPATELQRAWLDELCALPARHKVVLSRDPGLADPERWNARGLAMAYDGMAIEL